MRPPLVSVLMPAFNAARYIGRAAGSILTQTFTDLELIVVDDGSTDTTRSIVETLSDDRVRLIANGRNLGVSASLNIAAGAARGRYIARLDADDIAVPTRLERQVAFLDGTPECNLLASDTWEIQGDRCFVRPAEDLTDPRMLDWALHISNPIGASTTIFRTEVLQRLGTLADESLAVAEDFDFYHRVRRIGPIFWRPERLVYYRWHDAGLTGSAGSAQRLADCVTRVLENALRPLIGMKASIVASLIAAGHARYADDLRQLEGGLMELVRSYAAENPLSDQQRARTEAVAASLWRRIAMASLRSGVPASAVANARHFPLGKSHAKLVLHRLSHRLPGRRLAKRTSTAVFGGLVRLGTPFCVLRVQQSGRAQPALDDLLSRYGLQSSSVPSELAAERIRLRRFAPALALQALCKRLLHGGCIRNASVRITRGVSETEIALCLDLREGGGISQDELAAIASTLDSITEKGGVLPLGRWHSSERTGLV